MPRLRISMEIEIEVPRFSDIKEVASNSILVAKNLFHATGNAAWIAGISFIVLVIPLVMAVDREQNQINQLDSHVST
ncbi:mitochondrial-like import receptor subunit TOM9-2-like [Trifolium medium]|uniref:Mitochondrial-like import receptor subunit TOM9-2-like n=1 Tax=Trifolium medium TaxID=97028 RepID=A0A392RRW3_9FABA|nr:mitochondrial-like import receptor subunit TOM9-2-like [Trifolium medium]